MRRNVAERNRPQGTRGKRPQRGLDPDDVLDEECANRVLHRKQDSASPAISQSPVATSSRRRCPGLPLSRNLEDLKVALILLVLGCPESAECQHECGGLLYGSRLWNCKYLSVSIETSIT